MHTIRLVLLLLLAPTLAGAQPVYRCGNRYGHEPCKQGRVVEVTPPVRDLGARGSAQVFLCVSHRGGRFWAPSHCSEHDALIERIESVPAGLPWDQQVQLADRQTREGHAVQRRRMNERGAPSAGGTSAGDPARCAHWNAQVEHWDALARRPQSAAMQGWIAEQRKAVREGAVQGGMLKAPGPWACAQGGRPGSALRGSRMHRDTAASRAPVSPWGG